MTTADTPQMHARLHYAQAAHAVYMYVPLAYAGSSIWGLLAGGSAH